VRVQRVPCIGRCAEAPAAVVGRRPVAPADVSSIAAAVARDERECPLPQAQDYAAYRAGGGYAQLARVLDGTRDHAAVLAEIEASGLRGLGGAGFPVARKWRAVAGQAAPRLMVVNADEGEPGTFKDRHYLEHSPHRMLEGML